jgi:hypothetical protein
MLFLFNEIKLLIDTTIYSGLAVMIRCDIKRSVNRKKREEMNTPITPTCLYYFIKDMLFGLQNLIVKGSTKLDLNSAMYYIDEI